MDAVLLDVQLSTMSGLALHLAAIDRWPHLIGRIALMAGDPEGGDVRAWKERHRGVVFDKPFLPGPLMS